MFMPVIRTTALNCHGRVVVKIHTFIPSTMYGVVSINLHRLTPWKGKMISTEKLRRTLQVIRNCGQEKNGNQTLHPDVYTNRYYGYTRNNNSVAEIQFLPHSKHDLFLKGKLFNGQSGSNRCLFCE
jgi:hypothetical protein